MKILSIFIITLLVFLYFNKNKVKKSKNQKITKFKNKFLSKQSRIQRIFLRNDEITSSNPNINIKINFYENEEKTNIKSNIHRARLAKFNKSMLNGEMIYSEKGEKIYKYVQGKKLYL